MSTLIASSPLSSPPPDRSFSAQPQGSKSIKSYRPARELPFELAQHVQTYYEENLFTQAYTFLLSISGNSVSAIDRAAPVIVPQPAHLSLAATISTHPIFTTRTTSRDKREQANLALRLLRLIHQTAGPINAGFLEAFSFRRYDYRLSRATRFDDADVYDDEQDSASTKNELNTPYATAQGLWTRAEDFWQLVGWAFNCACLPGIHAKRWQHYQLLLNFLLDVLETDWELKTQSNNAEESLLWNYVELAPGGHARQRRMLRAIFADGSTRSTNEFRSIFPHELKEPLVEQEVGFKKREVAVDVDQEIYGDYLVQDDSDVSDEGDPQTNGRPSKRTRTHNSSSRRLTPRSSTGSLRSEYETGDDGTWSTSASKAAVGLGDHQSLVLRLRLLSLLTYVSSHPTLTATSPTTFPDLEELFTLFVEFIRPLPLPIFAYFVLPSSTMNVYTTMTLAEVLLQRLLETSAPSIRSLVLLSQQKLETEYLPFAAGKPNIDANARVSILLESLTRCLAAVNGLTRSQSLLAAVQQGIERRLGRAGEKKKQAKAADEAWGWLVESGKRMLHVVRQDA